MNALFIIDLLKPSIKFVPNTIFNQTTFTDQSEIQLLVLYDEVRQNQKSISI